MKLTTPNTIQIEFDNEEIVKLENAIEVLCHLSQVMWDNSKDTIAYNDYVDGEIWYYPKDTLESTIDRLRNIMNIYTIE